jgi:hypothetical protein
MHLTLQEPNQCPFNIKILTASSMLRWPSSKYTAETPSTCPYMPSGSKHRPLHAIWEQAQALVTAAPHRVASIEALITTRGGVGAIRARDGTKWARMVEWSDASATTSTT